MNYLTSYLQWEIEITTHSVCPKCSAPSTIRHEIVRGEQGVEADVWMCMRCKREWTVVEAEDIWGCPVAIRTAKKEHAEVKINGDASPKPAQ